MADFDREKFKALIHYVAWQTRDRDGWGLTKLFKVLWFFEAKRYTLHNEMFSGARYQRDEFGPRPRGAYPLLGEMEREGAIEVREVPYFNKTAKRAIPKRPPPAGLLNEQQSKDLQYWIDYVDEKTATEISEESHDYGWDIVPQGDDLPLVALLAERIRDPEADELEWAKQQAEKLRLP